MIKIDNREMESTEIVINYWRKNPKKKDNKDQDIWQMFIKQLQNVQQELSKDLETLRTDTSGQDYNKKVGRMAKDMFLKGCKTQKDVEKTIKLFLETNLEKINFEHFEKEINEEDIQTKEKTMFQRFKEVIKETSSKLFTMTKNSFENFATSFQVEALKIFDDLMKKLDQGFLWSPEIEGHFRILKSIVNNKTKAIKDSIDGNIQNIISVAEALDGDDIFPNYFNDYVEFPLSDVNLKQIEDYIRSHLSSTPVKWQRYFDTTNYFMKIFDFSFVKKYAKLNKDLIKTFLQNMGRWMYNRDEIEGQTETFTFLWIDWFSYERTTHSRFIEKSRIIQETKSLKQNLHKNVNEVKKKLIETIDDYLSERE